MGNSCKKIIYPEQKCNLLSHDETFESTNREQYR